MNELLALVGSHAEQGLTNDQVVEAQSRHGRNELSEAPPVPAWQRFAGQFKDVVIWILVVAALISGMMGEWVDALAIVAIVALNALISFFQEDRAERALAALQALAAPVATVIREGKAESIAASDIVPGDLLQLEAGDHIPADARLIRTVRFTVQEASLTGESAAVEKDGDAIVAAETPLADRRNMAYLGTMAVTGKASAVVVATGMSTELGQIAGLLQHHRREPTPLERRLEQLGRTLIAICLMIVGVIFVLQLVRGGRIWDSLLLAVSLAVAAVPEGLPAVVTITLALGLTRMVKRNALVRKLPSVETLGCVTVICSDKTGTLTRNEMTVRELVVGDQHYSVSGSGYAPRGQILKQNTNEQNTNEISVAARNDLLAALTVGARCNNARLIPASDGHWNIIGDPTEGALIVAAMKAGIVAEDKAIALLHEIPFDSGRKAMSVVFRLSDGSACLYTKGAPEVVLSKCIAQRVGDAELPLTDDSRERWLQHSCEMASRALRVLGLAYRQFPHGVPKEIEETRLVFAGLAGLIDPPREEVKEAVAKCHAAGIRPVMITGDHPATALAIARELQIAAAGQRAVTGVELEQMTDAELSARVEQVPVYARVTAEHKLRVVRAWQSRDQIVAMTGDGVNDAPAVKAADIGIAMGVSGSDVTKEASDMVLMDDNFASIVNAVEEGRGIYDNIQKVLQYLLSCNLGEILLMFVTSLIGWPAPLLPIQLLWINLVTDGLPALALALEPAEPDVMRRQPRPYSESILNWRQSWSIVLQGVLVAGVALAAFACAHWRYAHDVAAARAMTFSVLVYAELFRALAARSQTRTWGQLGFFSNPALLLAVMVSALLQVGIVLLPFTQSVFQVGPNSAGDWLVMISLALTPVTCIELVKLIHTRFVTPDQSFVRGTSDH